MNKRILLLLILISMGSVFAANPGHIAGAISPGTFNTGGNFIFPEQMSVTGNFFVDTNTLFVDSSSNEVGIGTASPSAELDVIGQVEIDSTITDADTATGPLYIDGAKIVLGDAVDDNTFTNGIGIKFADANTAHASLQYLSASNLIVIGDSSSNGNLLTPDTITAGFDLANRRLGVNTNSPTNTLDVNGSAIIRGDLNVTSGNDICIAGGNCLSTAGGSGSGNITGSGATNYFALFSNASNIQDSILSVSGGSLQVNGNIEPSGDFYIGSGATIGSDALAIGQNADASGTNSVALGDGAQANESNAIAIGAVAQSTGADSVAIGFAADALEQLSIAIGRGADTGGQGGVSIGYLATQTGTAGTIIGRQASGGANGIVAIGANANANGYADTAIGNGAEATGQRGVALGFGSNSGGTGTIAIGEESNASSIASIAIGREATTTTANQFVVGSSTAPITNFYIGEGVTTSSPQDIRIQASGTTGLNSAAADIIIAGGRSTGNATPGQVLIQTTTTGSNGTTLQTLSTQATINNTGIYVPSGNDFCIEGGNCLSGGAGSNVTGSGTTNTIPIWTGTGTLGDSIISESGGNLQLSGNIEPSGDFYIGSGATIGTNALAIGQNADASGTEATAIGESSISTGSDSVAVGYNAEANGTFSTAIGNVADAHAQASTAIGFAANAFNIYTVAIGRSATADAEGAVAIGYNAVANGTDSIVFGQNADASGEQSLSIGAYSSATGTDDLAIGRSAQATGQNGVALGRSAISTGMFTFAGGWQSIATADGATAIGANSNASSTASIALGRSATTTAANQFVVGSQTAPITNFYIGEGVTTSSISDVYVRASGGSGSNNPAGDLIIASGASTGNANPGHVEFYTSDPATISSGSTPQTLERRGYFDENGFYVGSDTLVVDATNDEVGIGVADPTQKLEVNGGVRLNTATSKPTCTSGVRGTLWFEQSSSGTDDFMYACMKNASDSYNWVMVARGS